MLKPILASIFLSGFLLFFTSCPESGNAFASPAPAGNTIDSNYHDGDIIFQTSQSGQSVAIQLATHSLYSHCGLLFNDNGKWMVYEAIQPVCKTPLEQWIARGDSSKGKPHYFVVRRLAKSDSIMTPQVVKKMREAADKRMGKNYDLWFGWSDENIYCSELVWKSYNEATGLEVGSLRPLGEYDLSSPIVKKELSKRYGKKLPLEEPMISPGSIFESELLVTVRE
jgi:hypothetical protein